MDVEFCPYCRSDDIQEIDYVERERTYEQRYDRIDFFCYSCHSEWSVLQ